MSKPKKRRVEQKDLPDEVKDIDFEPLKNIHHFIVKRDISNLKFFIDVRCLLNINEYNITPLTTCVYFNYPDILELFLKNGAKVDYRETNRNTALHVAIKYDRSECFKILMDHNASVDIHGQYGESPLHIAAKYNRTQYLYLLEHFGATKSIINHKQQVALYYAKTFDSINFFLKSPNVNVNIQDIDGNSPLHYIFQENLWEDDRIINLFFSKNANFHLQNNNNETPFSIYIKKNSDKHKDIIHQMAITSFTDNCKKDNTCVNLDSFFKILHPNIYTLLHKESLDIGDMSWLLDNVKNGP